MAESASKGFGDTPLIPHGSISTAEVRLEDFQEALRDPEVKKFLLNARLQGEKLDQQGRIHYR